MDVSEKHWIIYEVPIIRPTDESEMSTVKFVQKGEKLLKVFD